MAENQPKDTFLTKIKLFLEKIDPFQPTAYNELTGKPIESSLMLRYRDFAQWLIDVMVNGFFTNFVLAVLGYQQFHLLVILADGIAIWLISMILRSMWSSIVDGLFKIKRG